MTVCPTELKNLPVANINFANRKLMVLQLTEPNGANVTLKVIPDSTSVDLNREVVDIFDNHNARIASSLQTTSATVTLTFTALPFTNNDGNKVIYTLRGTDDERTV